MYNFGKCRLMMSKQVSPENIDEDVLPKARSGPRASLGTLRLVARAWMMRHT